MKPTKKLWGHQLRPKLGPKLDFLSFFQVWFISFLWYCTNCSLGQCRISCRVEASKKNFVAQIRFEMIFSILISLSTTETCLFDLIFPSIFVRWHLSGLAFRKLPENQSKSLSIFFSSNWNFYYFQDCMHMGLCHLHNLQDLYWYHQRATHNKLKKET